MATTTFRNGQNTQAAQNTIDINAVIDELTEKVKIDLAGGQAPGA